MKLVAAAAVLFASFFAAPTAVLAAKPDLAPDASLRIGVKHRVPAEECTRKSRNGDRLSMHYTGTLRVDDSKFDSSVDRGQPFDFVIGVRCAGCSMWRGMRACRQCTGHVLLVIMPLVVCLQTPSLTTLVWYCSCCRRRRRCCCCVVFVVAARASDQRLGSGPAGDVHWREAEAHDSVGYGLRRPRVSAQDSRRRDACVRRRAVGHPQQVGGHHTDPAVVHAMGLQQAARVLSVGTIVLQQANYYVVETRRKTPTARCPLIPVPLSLYHRGAVLSSERSHTRTHSHTLTHSLQRRAFSRTEEHRARLSVIGAGQQRR